MAFWKTVLAIGLGLFFLLGLGSCNQKEKNNNINCDKLNWELKIKFNQREQVKEKHERVFQRAKSEDNLMRKIKLLSKATNLSDSLVVLTKDLGSLIDSLNQGNCELNSTHETKIDKFEPKLY